MRYTKPNDVPQSAITIAITLIVLLIVLTRSNK
jgi:hypothetical protein